MNPDKRGPKRTADQRQADRQLIAALRLQGHDQQAIADTISQDKTRPYRLSQQQIAYDLKAVRAAWRDATLHDADLLRAEELSRLDWVIRQASASFAQNQNPQYLAEVRRCSEQRARLMGIESPKKVDSHVHVTAEDSPLVTLLERLTKIQARHVAITHMHTDWCKNER